MREPRAPHEPSRLLPGARPLLPLAAIARHPHQLRGGGGLGHARACVLPLRALRFPARRAGCAARGRARAAAEPRLPRLRHRTVDDGPCDGRGRLHAVCAAQRGSPLPDSRRRLRGHRRRCGRGRDRRHAGGRHRTMPCGRRPAPPGGHAGDDRIRFRGRRRVPATHRLRRRHQRERGPASWNLPYRFRRRCLTARHRVYIVCIEGIYTRALPGGRFRQGHGSDMHAMHARTGLSKGNTQWT